MESCNRKLCTHKEGLLLQRKTLQKMENSWNDPIFHGERMVQRCHCLVTDHTEEYSNSRDLQRDLTYLYNNYSMKEISPSYWLIGGQKQAQCIHPKYTYPLFNVQERRAPWDPFGLGLVTNTNIALNTSTPKQPKWGFLKPCKSVTLHVRYRQYFRLFYVPLTFTYLCNIIFYSYFGSYNLCLHQLLGP